MGEELASKEPTPLKPKPGTRPRVPSLDLWARSQIGRLFHTIIQTNSWGRILTLRNKKTVTCTMGSACPPRGTPKERVCFGRPTRPNGIRGGPLTTKMFMFVFWAAVALHRLTKTMAPLPSHPTPPKGPELIGEHMRQHAKGFALKYGQYTSIVHIAMAKAWHLFILVFSALAPFHELLYPCDGGARCMACRRVQLENTRGVQKALEGLLRRLLPYKSLKGLLRRFRAL